jgi:hypothetical protein
MIDYKDHGVTGRVSSRRPESQRHGAQVGTPRQHQAAGERRRIVRHCELASLVSPVIFRFGYKRQRSSRLYATPSRAGAGAKSKGIFAHADPKDTDRRSRCSCVHACARFNRTICPRVYHSTDYDYLGRLEISQHDHMADRRTAAEQCHSIVHPRPETCDRPT